MSRLPHPPLLLITDRRQAARPLREIVEAALSAGCRWVSVREKDLPQTGLASLLDTIRPLAALYGARLGLHGSAENAAKLGLDAVHLSAGSDARAARRLLGEGALIGLSVHCKEEAEAIDPADVDYAIMGPAFATASKPGYGPALGLEGIASTVRSSPVPIIALGGVDAGNVHALLAAGAAGVAVMGGVMRSKEPLQTVTTLLHAFGPT